MFEKDLELIRGDHAQSEFVRRIYEGLNKSEACADMRINPAAVGIVRKENKTFNQAIRDAEAFRVDMLVDSLPTINDQIECPIMAGVVSKNIMWQASKRERDVYGDKTDINVNHSISLTQAIRDAETRTIEHIRSNTMELLNNSTDNISVEHIKIPINGDDDDPFN